MNLKIGLGFVAGVLVASGISYVVVHKQNTPTVAASTPIQVEQPTPAAPVSQPAAEQPKPAESTPSVGAKPPKPKKAAQEKAAHVAEVKEPTPNPAPVDPASALVPATTQPNPTRTAPEPDRVFRPDPQQPAPPAARQPNTATLARGMTITVRLLEGLSSDRNKAGDGFAATLDQPVVVNDFVIAERGSRVEGKVIDAVQAGRVRGLAQLNLELTKIHTSDGQAVDIHTASVMKEGPQSKGEDAAKVGIGAALGAIIGAVAGGGKGAAIGAGAGGAAGAGTVAATRGKPAVLPVESHLAFTLQEPVMITEQLR